MQLPIEHHPGGAIEYTVGDSSLGHVLVARSARGIVAILLGDGPAALVTELVSRFRGTLLQRADDSMAAELAQVIARVECPAASHDVALDVRGTAFQQRVWSALREIHCGTTQSYTDVARRIGAPQAVRAVAGACAANPIAVVIPCHRVRRGNGDLAGYRWGVARKRALLEREAAQA
jgi:AraC family transcriptional regulator, regulatory protein of adaptative response / methylated-DNA-[protein]-cysteine methyltransferase